MTLVSTFGSMAVSYFYSAEADGALGGVRGLRNDDFRLNTDDFLLKIDDSSLKNDDLLY